MKIILFTRAILIVAIGLFVVFALVHLFRPCRLPNTLVYCLCAWLLARARNTL